MLSRTPHLVVNTATDHVASTVLASGGQTQQYGHTPKNGQIPRIFDVAEVLPLPCAMDLIKGRKIRRAGRPTEDMYRFPAGDERWEVTCSEEVEREEREVPAEPRRRDLPIAS